MIESTTYGVMPDGREIEQFTLSNPDGSRCKIITYGGIITELWVPDRDGMQGNVVLGLPSLESYLNGHPYLSALTGRVAGRITGGKFTLDGTEYTLDINDPPNHLHGGLEGLDKKVWTPEVNGDVLTLHCLSPDGDQGYPGNLNIRVDYEFTVKHELKIRFRATTDAPTPFSPTNHAYFNLAGEDALDITGHRLQVLAGEVVLKDDEGTLSGVVTPVEGTPHDFREEKSLNDFVLTHHLHGENYVLRRKMSAQPEPAARLSDPGSGRRLEALTNATTLQLYTSQTLAESELVGISGKAYPDYAAVCLECQGYPQGVSQPEIGDIVLRPGQEYDQCTVYRFSVDNR